MFSVAYRILGSVSEAEDVIQEAWLRYAASGTRPDSPKAFLTTIVTRLSINELRSARRRREQYVGEWFPEPLLADPYQDPERAAQLQESVSLAALLLLERLTPLERAVFVLREVFGFGFTEIAPIIGRSEVACRQLSVRARRHMDAGDTRFTPDRGRQEQLAARFFAALTKGDLADLRDLLAADVRLAADSGGKAPSVQRAVVGADKVARLLLSVQPQFTQIGITLERQEVNGQPGAVFRDEAGRVLSVMVLSIVDGRVQSVSSVINPEKLGHLGPVADAWSIHAATLARKRQH